MNLGVLKGIIVKNKGDCIDDLCQIGNMNRINHSTLSLTDNRNILQKLVLVVFDVWGAEKCIRSYISVGVLLGHEIRLYQSMKPKDIYKKRNAVEIAENHVCDFFIFWKSGVQS